MSRSDAEFEEVAIADKANTAIEPDLSLARGLGIDETVDRGVEQPGWVLYLAFPSLDVPPR